MHTVCTRWKVGKLSMGPVGPIAVACKRQRNPVWLACGHHLGRCASCHPPAPSASPTLLLASPPSCRSYCAGNYKPELPAMEELEPGTFYLVRAECSLVMPAAMPPFAALCSPAMCP